MSPSHRVFFLLASQTTVTSLLWEHLLCASSNLQTSVSLQQNFMPTLFQLLCLVSVSCWESLNTVSSSLLNYPWICNIYYPKNQENQIKILWPNKDWEHTKGIQEEKQKAPWTFLLDFVQGSTFINLMLNFIYTDLYNVKYSLLP